VLYQGQVGFNGMSAEELKRRDGVGEMGNRDMDQTGYELLFESLDGAQSACAFPCDACGQVDMDRLGDSTLEHYLFARAVIGHQYRLPSVRRKAAH
jgi:hypothetical protein